MSDSEIPLLPSISLSHFELYVDDVSGMEEFYTKCLGFVVTDRGEGRDGMVFLSKNPEEHHQLVLNPRKAHRSIESPVDHISFRVDALSSLRAFYSVLKASPAVLQTVSHGTTWSLYFRDPEENRLELFTDTPWHVNQPCRFEIDLSMSDEDLLKFTEHRLQALPGFDLVKNWKQIHATRISRANKV